MTRKQPPKLAVVGAAPVHPVPLPPDDFDAIATELWSTVLGNYEFDDPGSIEVLAQACRARSRAARCAEAIARDGEVIRLI